MGISLLVLLLALPAAVQAQFTYTTNNGTITITGYTGPGGNVTIPDTIKGLPVTAIGVDAFGGCTRLISVTIPNSVTSIGANAFYFCTTPAGVTIPNSVTSIGDGAFKHCTSLTSVAIGNSVTSIGYWAFYYCTSLTSVYFQGNAPKASTDVFAGHYSLVYYLPGTTGYGPRLGGCATLLWNPQMRSSAVRTNRFGFTITGTTNIPIVVEASTNVASPSWTALQNCTLTNGSVYFSDPEWTNYPARFLPPALAVTRHLRLMLPFASSAQVSHHQSRWGAHIAWVLALPLLVLPGLSQAQFNSVTNNGTITITSYTGPGGDVTIPDTINGLPVTSIGASAFMLCTNLTNVAVPNSVSTIGKQAFQWCSGLTNVMIGDSVTSIGDSAFEGCTALPGVTIPNSVISIGRVAFSGCSGLTSLTIPNRVTSIGDASFGSCTRLTNVTIPDSVTSIGDAAFATCNSLKGVYFNGNPPSPGGSVFLGDSHATVYYLPGTTGWGATFGGRPTALWVLPYPQILTTSPSFGIQTNRFGFIISWATNLSVVVEASTALAHPVWVPLGTNALVNGWSYFSDPNWTNYPARFYRIRSL